MTSVFMLTHIDSIRITVNPEPSQLSPISQVKAVQRSTVRQSPTGNPELEESSTYTYKRLEWHRLFIIQSIYWVYAILPSGKRRYMMNVVYVSVLLRSAQLRLRRIIIPLVSRTRTSALAMGMYSTQNGTLEFKDGYVQECPTYGNTPDPNIRTHSRQAFRLYTYVQLATKQRGVRMHRRRQNYTQTYSSILSQAKNNGFQLQVLYFFR
ncbi:hypothetical protein C8Q75DRAFT_729885 [Abortiporus biennis]|nr:hypothetical protein C8Q75DRAFT_729885 [Abortiporus biennis]